ncbi:hypothetical protein [Thermonema rossianum]|uniref:hypothetical protein n=1 Tax=Thermonema rossianum TaxID=55505 RepID=UPI0005704A33|nr:hypothetical protein [Thermonema rossianum]
MKSPLLLLFLLLSLSFTYAQNNTPPANQAEQLAHDLCTCVSDYFEGMHPAIQSYMKDMLELGEAEATRLFSEKIENMSAEEQQKVQQDAQRMQDIANDPAFARCAQLVQDATMSDEQALDFQNYLMNASACSLMRTFMLLGQARQASE